MTDLETKLRRALRVSQDPGCDQPAFDVAGIISRGRRLRWRRRVVAVGGGLCVTAALAGAATGIGKLATSPIHPAQHVVGPARSVPAPTPSRAISPPSPTAIPTAAPSATPIPARVAASGAQPVATSSVSTASPPQPTATPTPSATPKGARPRPAA
jgi:hypothetical protein